VIFSISQRVAQKSYKSGEQIIRQGDIGEEIYFIVNGKAEVKIMANGCESKKIANLYAHQFFGEMSQFMNGVRTASVYATEPTEVLVLAKEDICWLKNEYPIINFIFGVMAEERSKY
jgi:CRP-like cAMP-binding protein